MTDNYNRNIIHASNKKIGKIEFAFEIISKSGTNIGSIRLTVHLSKELNRNIIYGNNKKIMQDNICIE